FRALERALALGPEDYSSLSLLASFLTQEGRGGVVIELTAPYMRFSEPDPDIGLVRALAQARLGRFEEALATLDVVAAVDPELATVEVHRGTVLLMAGRREAARQAYRAALETAPDTVAALTALAVMTTEEGRVDAARDYWRRAGAVEARAWGRLLALAMRLWESGDRRSARPLLELFVEAAPSSIYADEVVRVRRLLGFD
ncbi:MAG: tetratricopeptide repeat protein, partial [Thermoanaerobaculia bacterium]|nr:tetratricopeptide repeat protein [Thermoanaerobaculia bacterium]